MNDFYIYIKIVKKNFISKNISDYKKWSVKSL